MTNLDHILLRLAFTEARRALEHGNHPFGAVLADADGAAFLAAENSVLTQSDATAHAELNLIRAATQRYDPAHLASCTLYASSEPCPMCAGAIVWGNIRRVVFGLGMTRLYAIIDNAAAASLKLHAKDVFAHAPWPIETVGPALESEALVVHQNFW